MISSTPPLHNGGSSIVSVGPVIKGGTRVWVKASAVDEVRGPKLTFKERMAKNRQHSSHSYSGTGAAHHSFSTASVTSFTSARDFSDADADSDFGSLGFSSSHGGRNQPWGWKSGYMMDSAADIGNSSSQSRGGDCISVRLEEVNLTSDPKATVSLPSSAINDGDVVLANEYQMNKDGSPICPDDLITLTHLHEPSVVECLHHRYIEDSIYTNTGPVLLALNPFQRLRGLYGEATMKRYWDKAEKHTKDELPPHVYQIADNSFRSMMRQFDDPNRSCCDQSILVSGESGAGKTVTAKFVMKYLAALSERAGKPRKQEKRAYLKVAEKRNQNQQHHRKFSNPSWAVNDQDHEQRDGFSTVTTVLSGKLSSGSIEAQVLQSNPILESFGNARTVRNDNSSRFGKFIEIQFTNMGRLVGAQIDVYLLEKVRLITQSPGERNYHIFFEMMSGGMDASELRKFFIASTATPEDFRITANGTYDRRDGVTDKETYQALRTAMEAMDFLPEDQRDVFCIIAAILHASNLTFCDLGQESALDKENVHLEPVCRLLGVKAEELNQSLCYCSITAGKNSHVRRLQNVDQAEKGLDAFLKATYGALFLHLVKRINDSICFKEHSDDDDEDSVPGKARMKPSASIGVLDIFGFESFQTNSFEQLCINYCNEALQQQFNAFVLKNEQAEYKREGIDWSFIQYPENQDVLDLIEKRGTGLLSVLDDQCRAPGTSDKSFALAVYNQCRSQNRFSASRRQKAVLQFSVKHYAGCVEYETAGFIEKNRDELPKEAVDLLKNSTNPFVQLLASTILDGDKSSTTSSGSSKPSRQDSSVSRTTVGGHFRRQLRNLRNKIERTSPHYIRCLKPNDDLIPDHFDQAAMAEQLRCGGILEAVRVARAGFSNHYSHESFLRRYRCLAWKELKSKTCIDRGSFPPSHKFVSTSPLNHRGVKTFSNIPLSSTAEKTPKSTNPEPECRELLKAIYKKLQPLVSSNGTSTSSDSTSSKTPSTPSTPPTVKSKTHSYRPLTPPPSWTRPMKTPPSKAGLPPVPSTAPTKSRKYAPWEKPSLPGTSQPPASPTIPRHTFRRGGSSAEWAKLGIQIGKTKVFLRHTVFEAIERMRSNQHAQAAVKLNSIFRMYLARMAFIEVLSQVRQSFTEMRSFGNEFKETKEQEYEDGTSLSGKLFMIRSSFASGQVPTLADQFATQIRTKIHNPVPRNEWGKDPPSKPFKWKIVNGLWAKTEVN